MPINMKQPIYVDGEQVTVAFVFPNRNFAVLRPRETLLRQFDRFGRPIDNHLHSATNEAPVTMEVVTLYPNGAVYVKDQPVANSSYGVDQLIQVRVVKQGGRIVHKELL